MNDDLTWSEIHHLFPGPAALGRMLGVSRQRAHQIRKLSRPVASHHWGRLIEWAVANGHADRINAESLARLASNGRGHG